MRFVVLNLVKNVAQLITVQNRSLVRVAKTFQMQLCLFVHLRRRSRDDGDFDRGLLMRSASEYELSGKARAKVAGDRKGETSQAL